MYTNMLFNRKCSIYGKSGTNGSGEVVVGGLIKDNVPCKIENKEYFIYSGNTKEALEDKTCIYISLSFLNGQELKYDYTIVMDDGETYEIKKLDKHTCYYGQYNHYKIEVI